MKVGWERFSIWASSSDRRGALGCLSVTVWTDTQCFLWQSDRGWSFEVMIDRKAFISIPNCLDVECQKMTIIVIGRRPTCWKCGQTGHLSSSCTEVLASAHPNPRLVECVIVSVSPVMGMATIRTGVDKPPVGSNFQPRSLCPLLMQLRRRGRRNG